MAMEGAQAIEIKATMRNRPGQAGHGALRLSARAMTSSATSISSTRRARPACGWHHYAGVLCDRRCTPARGFRSIDPKNIGERRRKTGIQDRGGRERDVPRPTPSFSMPRWRRATSSASPLARSRSPRSARSRRNSWPRIARRSIDRRLAALGPLVAQRWRFEDLAAPADYRRNRGLAGIAATNGTLDQGARHSGRDPPWGASWPSLRRRAPNATRASRRRRAGGAGLLRGGSLQIRRRARSLRRARSPRRRRGRATRAQSAPRKGEPHQLFDSNIAGTDLKCPLPPPALILPVVAAPIVLEALTRFGDLQFRCHGFHAIQCRSPSSCNTWIPMSATDVVIVVPATQMESTLWFQLWYWFQRLDRV